MLKFEWDARKADENIKKHGVMFEEASTIFCDPLSITVRDASHSDSEDRFVTIGVSEQHRLLVVAHTDRGNTIRLVSARKVTRRERRDYEEGQ
jgi:uncharacterized protein